MTMSTTTELVSISPVVPVVVIDDAERAVPLAQALLGGGVGIIEVTLRTAAAQAAIERIATEVPDMVVGAGTVRSVADIDAAVAAGASFLVSPGSPPALVDALEATGQPFLPGAATLTEMMQLLDRGHRVLKFFPAEAAGGAAVLKAVGGPLPELTFCPTGGVSPGNVATYLGLANVACVGGSWLAPPAAVSAGDWATIERLATAAAKSRDE